MEALFFSEGCGRYERGHVRKDVDMGKVGLLSLMSGVTSVASIGEAMCLDSSVFPLDRKLPAIRVFRAL